MLTSLLRRLADPDQKGALNEDDARTAVAAQLIKQGVPHEERASVLEALWRVVLADSQRDADEEALMRRVTDLLGLDTRDSVEARQRAQAMPG